MNATIQTQSKKFKCHECDNENEIPDGKKVGDVIECGFCGIEYELTSATPDGEFTLQILEEEK